MEFSYNFGQGLKIDVEAAKQKQAEREQKEKERKKEFDKLKEQMETSLGNPLQIKTPQLSNTKFENNQAPDEDLEGADDIEDETPKQEESEKLIEDYYGENEELKEQASAGNDDGIDLNYSQTHLDDFLKS